MQVLLINKRAPFDGLGAELGLDRVVFAGYVSEQRKRELFAESLVFALPTYIEGMPLTLVEAMAHGCAVVNTDTYGVRDVVSDWLAQRGAVS